MHTAGSGDASVPRLKIAAHNGAHAFGGGEKWIVLLLAGLQARGHIVRLYCQDKAMAERVRPWGVPAFKARLGGQAMLTDAGLFALELRRWRPSALLVSTFKKVFLAGMAARIAGVPRVVARVSLSTDRPGRNWGYAFAYRRWVDAALLNADEMRLPFLRELPGYDPRRVATVYDGVRFETPNAAPGSVRRDLGIAPDTPVIGTVTRLVPQKRIDRLLHVAARLPGVHCVIAGEGALAREMRERARQLGVAERVHFLGFREDVPDVLAALDLFVLTSDGEGMANAMLEALAAGVPVVSTPVSGALEALATDQDGPGPGLVVDAARIPGEIERLLKNRATLDAMSAAARERVRERFSFERMVDIWERVLGGEPPGLHHQGGSPLVPALQ